MARSRVWAFLKKVGRDIDDQLWNRTGPHGAAELGAALFGQSNAYVMYGHAGRPGDARSDPEAQPQKTAEPAGPEPEQQPDRERKGRSR